MHFRTFCFIFCVFHFSVFHLKAQETQIAERTFIETRVVSGHSVETNPQGVLKFIIYHRFGSIDKGIYDFFGFDDANMRLGFDYGVKNWFTLGIGRSSYEKTYDGYIKLKLVRQKSGQRSFPFTITYFSSMAIKTVREVDEENETELKDKTYYANQILIARKFSNAFSLQLMPSLIHRNLVQTSEEKHDVMALGIAPRLQLSKRISVNVEYYHVFPDQLADIYVNSLGIGFDIETKGHVFQLNFSNSRGLIEKAFITETTDQWDLGQIHFGFNLTRDFKIGGRSYRKYEGE